MRTRQYIYLITTVLLFAIFGCKPTKSLSAGPEEGSAVVLDRRTPEQIKSSSLLLEARRSIIHGQWKEAVLNLQEALKSNPENDAAYYELSRIYQSPFSGLIDMELAVKYAKKSIALSPSNIWYQKHLIEIYQQDGNFEEAAKEAKKLARKYPDNKGYYYQWANMYIRAGNYKQALKAYREYEKHFGFDAGVVKQQKQIYLRLGKYDQALKAIDNLIAHDPQNTSYYGMAADIYMDRQQYDKAYEYYQKILAIDPDDGKVHLALADYYRSLGDNETAYKETLKAIGSPKLDINIKMVELIKYFQDSKQGRYAKKQVFELLDTLVEVHPKDPKALALNADFLNREGRYTEALDYFHRVIAIDSSRYLVWEQMLLVEQRLKNYKAMADESRRAIHLFPQQPNLYYFSGFSNLEIGNYEQAEKDLKMGLNFVFDEKTKSDFYAMMAQAEFKQHEFGPAEDHFDMAVKLNPLNATALKDYAYYLAYHNKELDKALQMARKALELQADKPDYIYVYAFVLFKAGNKAEADKWVKDALIKYPDNKDLKLLDQEINKNE